MNAIHLRRVGGWRCRRRRLLIVFLLMFCRALIRLHRLLAMIRLVCESLLNIILKLVVVVAVLNVRRRFREFSHANGSHDVLVCMRRRQISQMMIDICRCHTDGRRRRRAGARGWRTRAVVIACIHVMNVVGRNDACGAHRLRLRRIRPEAQILDVMMIVAVVFCIGC